MMLNLSINNKIIATQIVQADSFEKKLLGLMFKKTMNKGEGIIFENSNWIHTFFMRIPIDVLYVNKKNIIVEIQQGLEPWRFCGPRFKANTVIELWPGAVKENDIICGGTISVSTAVS